VSPERGARLLAGLLDILDHGLADFPWDPQVGSYLPQAERYLAARAGEDIAGRLQTGRSRNDQSGAAERLWMRDLLLEVAGDLLALLRAVLARAEEHADALMPGYTHFQHAQPSTFGHALMRHAGPLERDLQRLEGAFARTNLSAQGGAAMAGTSWPVNRARVAALLGHDGLVVNSADAGGFARDHLEEGVACLALLMSDVGRLATDLFVWHSWEFGFVEVADAPRRHEQHHAAEEEPHAFERVKALAGQAIGWLPAMMGCQRTVLSTDLDYAFGDDTLTPMGDACLGSLRLLTEGIATLIVHRDAMAAKAGAFWSTTSHLADELVRRYDLSFRDAHQIVGRFVRDAIAAGQTPATVDAALLARAAREAGRPRWCSTRRRCSRRWTRPISSTRARARAASTRATCGSTSSRSGARSARTSAGIARRAGAWPGLWRRSTPAPASWPPRPDPAAGGASAREARNALTRGRGSQLPGALRMLRFPLAGLEATGGRHRSSNCPNESR
jgi:argininosuccinate lyase